MCRNILGILTTWQSLKRNFGFKVEESAVLKLKRTYCYPDQLGKPSY